MTVQDQATIAEFIKELMRLNDSSNKVASSSSALAERLRLNGTAISSEAQAIKGSIAELIRRVEEAEARASTVEQKLNRYVRLEEMIDKLSAPSRTSRRPVTAKRKK